MRSDEQLTAAILQRCGCKHVPAEITWPKEALEAWKRFLYCLTMQREAERQYFRARPGSVYEHFQKVRAAAYEQAANAWKHPLGTYMHMSYSFTEHGRGFAHDSRIKRRRPRASKREQHGLREIHEGRD